MSDLTATTITTHSRLHLGLHDCGYATERLFGGVGITFKGFPTSVKASVSEETNLRFSLGTQLSDRALDDVNKLISQLESQYGTFSVEVISVTPEHRGFGSKTSLLSAIAWSVVKLMKGHQTATPADIMQLTGRGGTSGIGVNSFWYGGLIADGGHKASIERDFAPSAARTCTSSRGTRGPRPPSRRRSPSVTSSSESSKTSGPGCRHFARATSSSRRSP